MQSDVRRETAALGGSGSAGAVARRWRQRAVASRPSSDPPRDRTRKSGLALGGVSISFPSCQTNNISLLCTINLLALSPVTPRVVIARAHTTPANPDFYQR